MCSESKLLKGGDYIGALMIAPTSPKQKMFFIYNGSSLEECCTVCRALVVSQICGDPNIETRNTIILSTGTPKNVPLILGNPKPYISSPSNGCGSWQSSLGSTPVPGVSKR